MEHRTSNVFTEVLKIAAILILVVVPIRLYVAQPFIVSGASMAPTFATGEYLIVDELSYRFAEPTRGDVIIFRFPHDTSKFFIKRIIGMPGETIRVNRGGVTVVNDAHPNGLELAEPYVTQRMQQQEPIAITLGPDEYFVMGDNRAASSDSRRWGPLNEDFIVGRAFVRLYPFQSVDVFPGIAHPSGNEL